MGVALDRALSKIKSDAPRHAGLFRAQLRRAAEIDFEKLERIVRLVAARVESFARPAPLLRQPVAKTGAMDTARVLSASAPTAPTASCTPMTVDERF